LVVVETIALFGLAGYIFVEDADKSVSSSPSTSLAPWPHRSEEPTSPAPSQAPALPQAPSTVDPAALCELSSGQFFDKARFDVAAVETETVKQLIAAFRDAGQVAPTQLTQAFAGVATYLDAALEAIETGEPAAAETLTELEPVYSANLDMISGYVEATCS
jgi:hypothetical protein